MKTLVYLYVLPFFFILSHDFSNSNIISPLPLGLVAPPACLNCSTEILDPVYEFLDSYVSTCHSCGCQRTTHTFTVTVPVKLNNDCTQNFDSSSLINDYIEINLNNWLTPGKTIDDYAISILSTPSCTPGVFSSITISVFLKDQCPS